MKEPSKPRKPTMPTKQRYTRDVPPTRRTIYVDQRTSLLEVMEECECNDPAKVFIDDVGCGDWEEYIKVSVEDGFGKHFNKKAYDKAVANYNNDIATFDKRTAKYEQDLLLWKKKEIKRLQAEAADLQNKAQRIKGEM